MQRLVLGLRLVEFDHFDRIDDQQRANRERSKHGRIIPQQCRRIRRGRRRRFRRRFSGRLPRPLVARSDRRRIIQPDRWLERNGEESAPSRLFARRR